MCVQTLPPRAPLAPRGRRTHSYRSAVPSSRVAPRREGHSAGLWSSVRRGAFRARSRSLIKRAAVADLRVFRSDEIELDRRIRSLGIMNITSYTPPPSGGMGSTDLDQVGLPQFGGQDAQQDSITATVWTGWIRGGDLGGTRVFLKSYPAKTSGMDGLSADTLAANELATHAALQPPSVEDVHPGVCKLLGGFVSGLGGTVTEQWLVFRNDGTTSAEVYAKKAAEAGAKDEAVGEGEFWDRFDPERPLKRRKVFVLKCLRQMLDGLAFMHSRYRLHQSLGPGSLLLSTTTETDAYSLQAKLCDLAFAIDVSDQALIGGATIAEVWERGSIGSGADPKQSLAEPLWRRARVEGSAWSEDERRNFGISDDIYAAGLLIAYMTFMPFCEPGSIDGPSIQRLFETTFRLDIEGARDYCAADDRWQRAVEFLDQGDRAGWDLLKAMLDPDWRRRPTAESCLTHPFLKGEGLE